MAVNRYPMKSGELRHYADVQQKTLTPNELNEQEVSWTTLYSGVPVSWPIGSADEGITDDSVIGSQSCTVRMHWLPLITRRCRLKIDGNYWYIKSAIDPTGRRHELVLQVGLED